MTYFMRQFDCKYCGQPIYFDDSFRSKNGKLIALDWRSELPHKCKTEKSRMWMAKLLCALKNWNKNNIYPFLWALGIWYLASLKVINSKTISDLIPPRAFQSQTGDNGVVLVVGGNSLYHGAPVLASIAALQSGSDLVYTAVPRDIVNVVRSFSPVLIALPLGKDRFTSGSASRLFSVIPNHVDAAAIGMGMTLEPQAC